MSAWLEHVKKTKKENPELFKKEKLKGILKLASKTYKKGSTSASKKSTKKRGGAKDPGHGHGHGHGQMDIIEKHTSQSGGGKSRKRRRRKGGQSKKKSRKSRRRRSRK